MFRRLLSAAALLLLLASPAQAAPINVMLTVDIYEPTYGPPEIEFGYQFFVAGSNTWPNGSPSAYLASGGGLLFPGVTQFSVSLEAASLDKVYFKADGFYVVPEDINPMGLANHYVAEPPDGHVSDALAYGYGPPWIPLANLGGGSSGDLFYIFGYPRTANGRVGTWAISAAPEVAPVPEPASMLLLGSGLLAVVARKYRQSKS